jgi:peroxiredoxin
VNKRLLAGLSIVAIIFGLYAFERSRFRHQRRSHSADSLAPDFQLPDVNGGQLRLSTYRGKIVLLDFWATWCDPCREEIPQFVDLQNKYRGDGLQIIGVSMDDSPQPVREFYAHFKMNYPVAIGNAKIGDLYGGILGLPVALVIDRDGRVYARHIGAIDVAVLEKEIVALLPPGN